MSKDFRKRKHHLEEKGKGAKKNDSFGRKSREHWDWRHWDEGEDETKTDKQDFRH